MSKSMIILQDLVGRTILGELLEENKEIFKVKNPAMIHVQPTGQNQIQVQVLPLFVPDFVAAEQRKQDQVWEFPRSTVIHPVGLSVSEQLLTQYNRIFNPSPIITPNAAPVVNLFDSK